MFKSALLSLVLFSSGLLHASTMNSNNDDVNASPVQFRTPLKIEAYAKNLDSLAILNGNPRTGFSSTYYGGSVCFERSLKIDGVGAGMIVVDLEFENDAATNQVIPNDFPFDNVEDGIAHGTVVAAAAASKHPDANALAAGAKIYPIRAISFEERTAYKTACAEGKNEAEIIKNKYKKDYEAAEKNFKDMRKELESRHPSFKDDSFCEFMKEQIELYDLVAMVTEKYNRDLLSLNERIRKANPTPVLNAGLLDSIEEAISLCKAKTLPMPRVINMSLAFEVGKSDATYVVQRLTKILKENDMLLVVSAGNDSHKDENSFLLDKTHFIGQEIESANESRIDLRAHLDKYPDLCENLLIACAFFDNNKCAEYSSRAGIAQDYALVAMGTVFKTSTYKADGELFRAGKSALGTSYASPRVAAMAVVLAKYFPKFSAAQIKAIILKSSYKPQNFDPREIGQGALDPIQAWIDAVKLDEEVTSFPNKIKGWFKWWK